MKGLACVVVLYNPHLTEVFTHIQSYAGYVEHLYIVDNSPGDHSDSISKFSKELTTTVSYLPNQHNLGIARALNQGCIQAIKDGFSWCLLMDQDSYFLQADLTSYLSFFNENIQQDVDTGILSLLHGGLSPDDPHTLYERTHSITSGSIISLAAFKRAGGHDEFLFIDEVDADYSYRMEVLGYKTIRYNKAFLQHRLGEMRDVRLWGLINLGKRSFHAPWRNYYMLRNYLIVRHRYVKKLPEVYKKRDRDTIVSVKNNLFLSGKFFSVLYQLIRGGIDGLRYRRKLPVSDLTSSP